MLKADFNDPQKKNWGNLRMCSCPRCNCPLGGTTFFLECPACSFVIKRARFNEIVLGKAK